MKKFGICIVWFVALLFVVIAISENLFADTLGIYGNCAESNCAVTQESREIFNRYINTIFVPANSEIIRAHIDAGRKVYLTLNVFGGKKGWKSFPDSRPVQADGRYVSGSLGGICPTDEGWRRSRLDLLRSWLDKYGGDSGISGIWLDFIRYPGRWEQKQPDIPDTCYCDRCLLKFQQDTGVTLPAKTMTVSEKADWIKGNASLQWMRWKKEQITSFVRDARSIVDEYSKERPIKLGVFLVPWKKSDRNGSISFDLAQDPELLSPYVDVFSPMVYHQMAGRTEQWVADITQYEAELTGKDIWPIIQAENVSAAGFSRVIKAVSKSDATGLLVYRSTYLTKEQWSVLQQVHLRQNLIANPGLKIVVDDHSTGATTLPVNAPSSTKGWHTAPVADVVDSKFWLEMGDNSTGNGIGLTAGVDRQAIWTTDLPDCQSGETFLFSADFLRSDLDDGDAYPEVSLWGRNYRLNNHRMVGKYQKLKTVVTCPGSYEPANRLFQFQNNYPGNTFWMRSPELKKYEPPSQVLSRPVKSDFFPIGVYGANAQNLREIKDIGLNTAVVRMNRANIEKCLALNMRCTLSVARRPEVLIHDFEIFEPLLRQGKFAYYVNDEPGIHSFSESIAEDLQQIITGYFPKAVTMMAVVRPQVIPFYEKDADYFMLDQYPVPNMPMTWLSDSMDEAAAYVGTGRLESVIQAFGGEKYSKGGWPRLPTFAEMNCLTFLSIIHGSRGVYFYTFPAITSTGQGREDFVHLVQRLNSMRSWLHTENSEQNVEVRMRSPYRFDPRGNPAVHCTVKEMFNTQMLICVNSLATSTKAEIAVQPGRQSLWQDYFTSQQHRVVGGTLLAHFSPLEVKVLLESK